MISLSNTFFPEVFYLHSCILFHLFILNISSSGIPSHHLSFLLKESDYLFSDKCEFFSPSQECCDRVGRPSESGRER